MAAEIISDHEGRAQAQEERLDEIDVDVLQHGHADQKSD